MTTEAFLDAFDRMDAFQELNRDASPQEVTRALDCVEESLGISQRTSRLMIEMISARVDCHAERTMCYAGVLIGALAARAEAELGPHEAAAA